MEFDLEQLESLKKQRLNIQNSERTVKISNQLSSNLFLNYSEDMKEVLLILKYVCLKILRFKKDYKV